MDNLYFTRVVLCKNHPHDPHHATHTRASGYESTYLDKRVDHTNVGTGIEDLTESSLSVDQLQLVELLVVLQRQHVEVILYNRVTHVFDDTGTGCLI